MANNNITREAVFAALFALFNAAAPPTGITWQTTGRRLVLWTDVPTAAQPAFFIHQGVQTATQNELALTKWSLKATLWIYFRTSGAGLDQNTPPATDINMFIDWVEKIIDPIPGTRQTLGNKVYHAFIDGNVVFDDGLADAQAVIVIPISILVGV